MKTIKNWFRFFVNKIKTLLNSRKRVAIFIILILLVCFGGWKLFGGKQSTQYQKITVERGTLITSISASGQMASVGTMTVTTQASGLVKNVYVKNGDFVIAGQNLMELTLDQSGQQKMTQAWSGYLSAKNSLDSTLANQFTLQSDLFNKWKTFLDLAQSSSYQNPDGSPRLDMRALPQFATVQNDWLAAEAKYKNSQAVIAQTQVSITSAWLSYQLNSSLITAPMSGTVSDLTLAPGMSLNTNSTTTTNKVASIRTDNPPIAQFNLSEIDINKVNLGQKATLTIDALKGQTFTGKVIGIDKTGTITSGVTTYPITIQFDTTNDRILANMSVTANIIINVKDNTLLLPTSAVQTQAGQTTVRMIKNGQIQEVTVETGLSSETQTEILSGVNVGDEVVIGTISNGQSAQTTSPFSGGLRIGGGFGGR